MVILIIILLVFCTVVAIGPSRGQLNGPLGILITILFIVLILRLFGVV